MKRNSESERSKKGGKRAKIAALLLVKVTRGDTLKGLAWPPPCYDMTTMIQHTAQRRKGMMGCDDTKPTGKDYLSIVKITYPSSFSLVYPKARSNLLTVRFVHDRAIAPAPALPI